MTTTNIIPWIHTSLFLALCAVPLGCSAQSDGDDPAMDASSSGGESSADSSGDGETGEPAIIEIIEGEPSLTMVNAWTPVEGVTVEELANAITTGIEADIRIQPGYIVTGVHRSLDESNVLVYGHWLDQAALEGVQGVLDGGGAPTFAMAIGLAEYTPHPYRVVSAIEPSGPASVTIAEGGECLTMVNTWTPRDGATVDEVATALQQAIGTEISQFPGFLAGSVLASLDGSGWRRCTQPCALTPMLAQLEVSAPFGKPAETRGERQLEEARRQLREVERQLEQQGRTPSSTTDDAADDGTKTRRLRRKDSGKSKTKRKFGTEDAR